MNIIGLGGMPATGKTTLMLSLMKTLGVPQTEKFGVPFVVWHQSMDGRTIVLGDYSPGAMPFGGTDKLSMACHERVEAILQHWNQTRPEATILFEGDRLFAPKFLQSLHDAGYNMTLYLLEADDDELQARHKSRKDSQTDTWLKGRNTKLRNIAERFAPIRLRHTGSGDTAWATKLIVSTMQQGATTTGAQPQATNTQQEHHN